MRFWLTRTGELSIREQIARQVLLGILSEDLAPGSRLPSIRSLARRYRIHSNTVSAAYHDLVQRGWLELRRGSGLYVRTPQDGGEMSDIDALLEGVLRAAASRGWPPEGVLGRLDQLVRPLRYQCVRVIDPELGMGEILAAELARELPVPVEVAAQHQATISGDPRVLLLAALAPRASGLRQSLPEGWKCTGLRLRSVGSAIVGQRRPRPDELVTLVSRSEELRRWARAMLVTLGIAPESLCEVDAALTGWRGRVLAGGPIISDAVTGRDLDGLADLRIYRVISDSSISEVKRHVGCACVSAEGRS